MLLAAIMCVSLVELAMTATRYGGALKTEHWQRARERLRADTPLIIGTPWLGPEARMRLDAAGTPEASGRPDLRGLSSFDVLRHNRDDPSSAGVWQASLSPRSKPVLLSTDQAGPLRVEHWRVEHPERVVDTLVHPRALRVSSTRDAERICPGNPTDGYTCPDQRRAGRRIQQQFAEVDYDARRCLSTPLPNAGSLSFRRAEFQRGDRIVGHLGFEDFNARLRNDGPVTMTVEIEGEMVARSTFSNTDGWAGFEIPTTPGVGSLAVSLHVTAPGRWASPPERYQPGESRRVCLELRALDEEVNP
jgi:hypothetical protein